MPSLLDAADLFSKLGKKSVEIVGASCVRVRHRRATCRACLQVCSHDAITIENNVLTIDQNLCTGCGACTSVCPTEALRLIDDIQEQLRAAIDQEEPGSTLTTSCEHARDQHGKAASRQDLASHQDKNAWRIPCLASLDESLIVHATCSKVALRYISADCAACPNANGTLIEDIIEQAVGLIDALCLSPDASQLAHPSWIKQEDANTTERPDSSPKMTRRGMFDHLVAHTTDSVAQAAVGTLYATHHPAEEQPTLAESLMEAQGVLKSVNVRRNAHILDDLYRQDPPVTKMVQPGQDSVLLPTRLFAEISLDAKRCDLCGICMTFCPTKALTGIPNPPVNPFVAATREVAITGELSFRANDCVACHLCVDICPNDALDLHAGIAPEDLFALEARELFVK